MWCPDRCLPAQGAAAAPQTGRGPPAVHCGACAGAAAAAAVRTQYCCSPGKADLQTARCPHPHAFGLTCCSAAATAGRSSGAPPPPPPPCGLQAGAYALHTGRPGSGWRRPQGPAEPVKPGRAPSQRTPGLATCPATPPPAGVWGQSSRPAVSGHIGLWGAAALWSLRHKHTRANRWSITPLLTHLLRTRQHAAGPCRDSAAAGGGGPSLGRRKPSIEAEVKGSTAYAMQRSLQSMV